LTAASTLQQRHFTGPTGERRHDWLVGAISILQDEVAFLNGLQKYNGPVGWEKASRTLNEHFKQKDGKLLAGLQRGKVHERLDPRHRAGASLQNAFYNWFADQLTSGQDPAQNVVDFFLEYDGDSNPIFWGSSRCMTVERRQSQRWVFRNGLIKVYYVTNQGGRKERYWPGMTAEQNSTQPILSLALEPYNSEGSGISRREGHDLVDGDTYVVAKNDDFFSCPAHTIHSEFLGGGRVQAAGLVVVRQGKVHMIDNCSGHYLPNWLNLFQAVSILNRQNVFDPDAMVGLVVSSDSTMFFPVADYIRLGKLGFPYGETRKVVSTYQRKYDGKLPVHYSKLRHVPEARQVGWHNGRNSAWDRFFETFYPAATKKKVRDLENLKPSETVSF
jgi:hypothetical protein